MEGKCESKNGFLYAILLVAILGLTVVSIVRNDDGQQNWQQNVLSVSGTHELEVAPDQAVLTLQVDTRGMVAKDVSAESKANLQRVMAALTAQGLTASDIETTGVTLQRWTEWDGKEQMQVDKGYMQITTLKVTIKNLDTVGAILDAAVQAGANSVQDVSFELRPETQEKYKQQALTEATKIAKQKAQLLAGAAGTELGKISSISENSYIQPYYYNTKAIEMDAAGAAPTPISPAKVTIQASVNLAYELE